MPFVDPYLIPGTRTLRNKLGITTADELARAEYSRRGRCPYHGQR